MNISPKQYATLLLDIERKDLDEKELDRSLCGIASVIVKNKDKKKLSAIERVFDLEKNRNRGYVNVKITSVIEISDAHFEKIKKTIGKKYNVDRSRVKITSTIDKTLIGGMKIQIGNEIIDASIKRKLKKILQSFK